MNLTEIRIIKRDGKQENFSAAKITNAIGKAFEATGIPQQKEELDLITRQVVSHFSQPTMGVEEIQDLVENELMKEPAWFRRLLLLLASASRSCARKFY